MITSPAPGQNGQNRNLVLQLQAENLAAILFGLQYQSADISHNARLARLVARAYRRADRRVVAMGGRP